MPLNKLKFAYIYTSFSLAYTLFFHTFLFLFASFLHLAHAAYAPLQVIPFQSRFLWPDQSA